MVDTALFCPLDHEGLLAVRGPDAAKFLQGQLTCNLDYLKQSSGLGARCTPKGRMLSSFRILPEGDGYLLAMAKELLEAQRADLQKYAVFSKVQLSDESDLWQRYGVLGEATLQALGMPEAAGALSIDEQALLVRCDAARGQLWVPSGDAEAWHERLSQRATPTSLDAWLLAQVRAGEGQVFGPTRELFIPQMINLQAVGGVSFRKGCYTGQEIVARMQYLGKLKRRMYRLVLDDQSTPAAGTELFSPVHGTSVGEVVIAAPADAGCEMLAVLQEDAVADGRIHLGEPNGAPLRLLDLPYRLDSAEEIKR